MAVTDSSSLVPAQNLTTPMGCPLGAASLAGSRPSGNPGHFGGIAILPLFLDEPRLGERRRRVSLPTDRGR
jgi:hypothetical protein